MIRMLIIWWHHECGAFFMIERLTGQGQKKRQSRLNPVFPMLQFHFLLPEFILPISLLFPPFVSDKIDLTQSIS